MPSDNNALDNNISRHFPVSVYVYHVNCCRYSSMPVSLNQVKRFRCTFYLNRCISSRACSQIQDLDSHVQILRNANQMKFLISTQSEWLMMAYLRYCRESMCQCMWSETAPNSVTNTLHQAQRNSRYELHSVHAVHYTFSSSFGCAEIVSMSRTHCEIAKQNERITLTMATNFFQKSDFNSVLVPNVRSNGSLWLNCCLFS